MNLDFLGKIDYWREKAESLKPVLKHWEVLPKAVVALQKDEAAWQGVKAEIVGRPAPKTEIPVGESIIFDFGEHLVGHAYFDLENVGHSFDAPAVLRILAAETPFELTYHREEYKGSLGVGWMQEETMRVFEPGTVEVPHRMALRYLRIDVIAVPGRAAVVSNIKLTAESAVGQDFPAPPSSLDAFEKEIYNVSCRTLRNCMQGVFEDGPKRDRRLWLGDLRLQALVNAATYRNAELVERSLYLLASDSYPNGLFTSCVFENQKCGNGCKIMEYPLLLAPLLLEHVKAYGRRCVADDLFDIAAHQFKLLENVIDADWLMHNDHRCWLVIDHSNELEKETALQCVYIFGLKALAELAQILGRDAGDAMARAEKLRNALRLNRYDEKRRMFFSGESHQFSMASQIWAVMAKVVEGNEARDLLARTIADDSLFPVCSPYMQHYFLEACQICGAKDLQRKVIREYWGEMVRTGATTFYEVFYPKDTFFSPYNDAWSNSTCHAWSCTPAIYLQ